MKISNYKMTNHKSQKSHSMEFGIWNLELKTWKLEE